MPNPLAPKIIEMYRDGMSQTDIARVLGLSNGVVWRALKGEPRAKNTEIFRSSGACRSGYRWGTNKELSPWTQKIIAQRIRGDETIVACMNRLIRQAYADQMEGK